MIGTANLAEVWRMQGRQRDPTDSPLKPRRILFLDMMRFIALAMMLQGHTVYAMLDHGIRDGDSTGIAVWRFFRGYTAPVFMTVAGIVFTYLLVLADSASGELTRRLKHGFLRVFTLLAWGYALRLPMDVLWTSVSQRRLDVGLATDVLHLIGFGLLLIVTVFLTCRPVLRRGIEHVSWVFLLLFLVIVSVSPVVSDRSFHRPAELSLSSGGLGVTLGNAAGKGGVVVEHVLAESRAWELGLRQGDVISRLGIETLAGIDDVPRAETAQRFNHPSPIHVLRGNDALEIPWVYDRRAKVFPNGLTFWPNKQPAPSGIASQFPIFPWCAYLVFGACLGACLAGMNRRHAIPRLLDGWLLGLAILLLAWAEFAPAGRQWLGGADSAIVFHRLGGVMLLASVMVFLSRWVTRLPPLVIHMSRNSLWLYIGHLILLYTIRPWIYRGKLETMGTIACVAIMFALMVGQTLLIERKRRLGSWKATVRSLSRGAGNQKSR